MKKRFETIVEECRTKAFKEHVATLIGNPEEDGAIWGINWKKPGTSNYWVDFVQWRGALFVRGDLGESVYVWYSSHLHPVAFHAMSFDYFHGKCEASEYGSRPTEWNNDAAEAWLDFQLEELLPECEGDAQAEADLRELVSEFRGVSDCKHDWDRKLDDYYHSGDDLVCKVLGDDAYTESGIYAAGLVPSLRTIMHWAGLQMALEQLGFTKGA